MPTKSFKSTYIIKSSDVNCFCGIMSDSKKIRIRKVKNKDIKDIEEYKKIFKIKK